MAYVKRNVCFIVTGGSNKELIREAEVDIEKLPEIPVHEMSSTHEPDGNIFCNRFLYSFLLFVLFPFDKPWVIEQYNQ